jgi:hypothetical protein
MQQDERDPIDEIDVNLDDTSSDSVTNHSKYPVKRRKPGSRKKFAIIAAAAVLVLAGAGGFAYWRFGSGAADDAQHASDQEQTEDENTEPQMDPAEAAQTVVFSSEELNLEFTHRRDWTVTESDDKTTITVTSPRISYQTADGNVPSSQGVFTLKIGVGVSSAAQQTINSAEAVEESEVVAYEDPTDEQRFYTNLSYAGQDGNFNFLIVTGSTEYQPGDPLANTLPLGSSYYLLGGGYGADPDDAFDFDAISPQHMRHSPVFEQAVAFIQSLRIN